MVSCWQYGFLLSAGKSSDLGHLIICTFQVQGTILLVGKSLKALPVQFLQVFSGSSCVLSASFTKVGS